MTQAAAPDMAVEVVPGAEPPDAAIAAWARLLLHLLSAEDQAETFEEEAAA